MIQEKEFFLRVLSDHLAGRETVPVASLDWERIVAYANAQQLGGIVETQCRGFMPKDAMVCLKQKRNTAIYCYMKYQAALNEIGSAFRAAGISFFVVKGLDVARYYPIPALRTMGDCDIVVPHRQMRAAVAEMKRMGFTSEREDTAQQWGASRHGLTIELHDALVQHGEFTNRRQRVFFNHFERYVHDGSLDRSFHFLFLLMHLRKHFLNYGAGFRQFMDLAVMIIKEPKLDWRWIEENLLALQLRDFAHNCYALLERWFGISAPVDYARPEKDFYEEITEQVFSGGVFGMDAENNLDNAAKTALAKARGPLWLRRLRRTMRDIFPSYQMMRGYAGCEYLYDRPYLLPAAWVHRIFMLFRKHRSNQARTGKQVSILDDEVVRRREWLNKMGL